MLFTTYAHFVRDSKHTDAKELSKLVLTIFWLQQELGKTTDAVND